MAELSNSWSNLDALVDLQQASEPVQAPQKGGIPILSLPAAAQASLRSSSAALCN
jgi:hypothetical protein